VTWKVEACFGRGFDSGVFDGTCGGILLPDVGTGCVYGVPKVGGEISRRSGEDIGWCVCVGEFC
jgi:hypothetical protein